MIKKKSTGTKCS